MQNTIRKVLTRKYLIITVAVLLLYTLAGFAIAPMIIRWYVPRYAQQNLHCQAGLERVRINPFLFSVEANGFNLKQADGLLLVSFDRLFVDLEMSSLFRWAVVLRELALDKPEIHLVFEPDGTINFEKLVPVSPQPPEPAKPNAKPFRFILQTLDIQQGRIAVVDKRQSTPADFNLEKLNLHLKDFSTVKDHNGIYSFSGTNEDGESIQWEGEISLTPLHSKGKLSLKAIRTASLWKFFRDTNNLEQPAGLINVNTEYHLDAAAAPVQMTLDGLNVSLSDLSLKLLDADKAFLQLKKINLDVPRFDLASRQLHVGKLLFEEGAVDVRIDKSGGSNLQRIIRAALPEKHHGEGPPSPAASSSESASGADQKTEPHSTLAVPASAPPPAADPSFKINADSIEIKAVSIALEDESRKTPVKAGIAGLDLSLKADVEVGSNENKVALREITSELKAINLQDPQSQGPLFATEKLMVEGGEFDLGARSITISRIALNKGRLDAGIDAEGKINWLQLLQTKGAAEEAPGTKPSSDAGPAWKFLVKSFEVEGFSSSFSDQTTHSGKPVLGLQGLNVKLTGVDGISPMGFSVSFQVEQGGTASVNGTVNPSIPSVEAEVNVSGVVLTSLQPYIEPYVTLVLQSASVSTRGNLRYGVPGDAQNTAYEGDFSLNGLRLTDPGSKKPYFSWDAVQIPKFKLTLQPNGLEVQEIKISKPVGEFIIGEDKTLNLAKVIKKKQGETKTPTPTKPEPIKPGPVKPDSAKLGAAKPGPTKPGPTNVAQKNSQDVFPYRLSKVQVINGNMVFADLSLRPRFMTRIHDLKGMVTGLSSSKDAQARVQMDGHVDQYGLVKISGVIRPNDFGRSSDIDLVFRNLEMKNLSPYSGKFAGRLIKTGKFSADLKYQIHDYKMTGDNKIIIDNLVLGEQVDEPGASNLPLDLAIALLRDANGRIDIGLPVTGDLNDPQFSIGPLIWKVLTNLITKAVTAPFRALGSLFGGEGTNFDAVEFDPGSADLPPPEKEKLIKIADAMKQRPQLKLVIQGRYSPEVDGMEFKDLSIRRMIATKQGVKLSPNDDPGPLDFTDSKTQNTVENLYKERFGKPSLTELEKGVEAGSITLRTPATHQEKKGKETGFFSRMSDNLKLYKIIPGGKSPEQATLWAGELYIRLVESEKVADSALQQLAGKRAQSIAAELEGPVQVPKERVGIKDPEPLSGDERPSVKLSLDAL